ncbi:MAG: hypothetical protein II828_01105 [Clostridia bacterium]|nr:hypothetical protein [Clostridia bacterium]MBQ4396099.1 hypothetical protein [Clostridia bacterium]
MIEITVPASDWWDEQSEQFLPIEQAILQLEHSLVSVSKWEAKWHKAFLGRKEKTAEELLDYVRCMTLTPNVNALVYYGLTEQNIQQINEYIEAPMTATRFPEKEQKHSRRETVTAELIYYWMISLNIPFECQYWHLNRLLALVRVCSLKNQPPKKMKQKDLLKRNAAINTQRRKQLHTKG